MSKEIGPREKQLREQREARFKVNQERARAAEKLDDALNRVLIEDLRESVAAVKARKPKPKKRKAKKR
jgi:hypothetical protein